MGNSPPSNRHSSRLAAYLLLHLRAGSNLKPPPPSRSQGLSHRKNLLRILRA